ncbi:c-type cytochrome biogenesis protein CcsB [Burkholderia thailandensis]|uniref:Cytochrome c-type biogenesis protein CcsB n=2 Tax=Burkholderia thailandensis TaxID=57975 RepID=A0AAW9D3Q2_BURTH|nr:c-type cytochrome biogenesis protein CcsB [Burkholderia thailandensis]ABC38378.1 cytochrome c assembly family protein [Burkholderia thailandensis E264]AHI63930.1 cytochrome c-type biogenesis protein CcsB [Burkholderia thailandensis H0587]AHI73957.1 cytochrome c-type biogenesis protein CcsB [Burkholderia thailandensis 2002721723]AHI78697.1 cytochrome c-type biogenesis protein CcsB [Burkholderia thailandensis E444]AIC86060.1 cytochrome c-type biogenesis protein CcsB [Burkholderia thailandensi
MDLTQVSSSRAPRASDAAEPAFFDDRPFLRRLSLVDWVFALALVAGAGFALAQYHAYMNYYDKAVLIGTVPALVVLGWRWKPARLLMAAIAALSLLSLQIYQGDLARADSAFLLKYFLSSQSAILWMSALFVLATLFYWIGMLSRSESGGAIGQKLTWIAVLMGFTGLMVRWYESYLIGADVGHIPVSNLYEVFVLFSLITALLYLYYEGHYGTRALGAFVLLVISAAVGFLMWYSIARDAQQIQPLVPALQSWWMKIHVPANFIGYGSFALSAMVAVAYLTKERGVLADRLPALEVLDDVMYKSIAVGFAFFTIATILGALWAAEAWGGYWSWDPKETWALIVWLNYAAWLHMRLMKGLRGTVAAWWALTGLLVTTFAFLGVNMFLSGLHSYGKL